MLCDILRYSKWMNLVKRGELLQSFPFQCAGSSEHRVGTLWIGTQPAPHQEWCPQPVEREEWCMGVLECEGHGVRVCYYHWHQRQFPLQTSAALWERLHNRRLYRPLLCYGNYKNPTALTIVPESMTDCDVWVFSIFHSDIKKKK